jgi:hypothetical protein
MTILTGAPPVSIAFAGPMSLASPPVSGEIYDDVKLCQIHFYKFKTPLLFDQRIDS